MKCNVCGRQTINEEANFCEYCGSSFREHMQQQPMNQMPPYNQGNVFNQGNPYNQGNAYNQENPYGAGSMPNMMPGANQQSDPNMVQPEKPTSFLDWLGTYGIMLIPCVGWLVFIVMLFIWGFGNKASTSKKNWARATLIFAGALLLILIAYLAMVMPLYMDVYTQMMNGTFDMNSYYNSINGIN
jgi:hypothetical protein